MVSYLCSVCIIVFLTAKISFHPRKTIYLIVFVCVPLWKIPFPIGLGVFPIGKEYFPSAKMIFPVGLEVFPVRIGVLLIGIGIFPIGFGQIQV